MSTSALTVSISGSNQALVVTIVGEASVVTLDQLSRELLPVNARHASLVVFDLSGLTFIASLGLGLLMECQRGLQRRGGQVRFAALHPNVLDVVMRCRLDTVLSLSDTVEQALAVAPASANG